MIIIEPYISTPLHVIRKKERNRGKKKERKKERKNINGHSTCAGISNSVHFIINKKEI